MSFAKNWIRKDIQSLNAYHVPEPIECLKLDAMESPFSPNQDFEKEFLQHLSKVDINRYPEPSAREVIKSLRSLMNIDENHGVLLGNGSDELIQLIALACNEGDTILSFSPSFVMYEMIAKFSRLNYIDSPLIDFDIDLENTLQLIKETQPKLIFIAYPNNPTGNLFDKNKIKAIIESTDALVVIDEAYYAYSRDSFLDDLSNYENILLLRTVSKIGFAGARLGLMIGASELIEEFNKIRLPYNINSLTQSAATFLLEKKQYLLEKAKEIIKERERVYQYLLNRSEVDVYPSDANFLLLKVADANHLFQFLIDNNILIKNLSNAKNLDNFLRVTIGYENENDAFMSALDQYYGE